MTTTRIVGAVLMVVGLAITATVVAVYVAPGDLKAANRHGHWPTLAFALGGGMACFGAFLTH